MVFTAVFTVEMVLKLIAFKPRVSPSYSHLLLPAHKCKFTVKQFLLTVVLFIDGIV